MKMMLASALLFIAIPALAQSTDALYNQACGPKDKNFQVEHEQKRPPTSPDPGKALVYIIQKDSLRRVITRIGLDGSWGGVVQDNSYIPLSVEPGEHHLCAATQNEKHPEAEFAHFTAEAGKVYFYLIRGTAADVGSSITMTLQTVDRDEALYLIASDQQSVAKPKP